VGCAGETLVSTIGHKSCAIYLSRGAHRKITMNKTSISRSNRRMDVLRLQLALERAWQPKGDSRRGLNRLGLSVRYSENTELGNQGLLERLEAENA
jgi:hypothetical protein